MTKSVGIFASELLPTAGTVDRRRGCTHCSPRWFSEWCQRYWL